MSDRIADECEEIAVRIEKIRPETDGQEDALELATRLVRRVAESDRTRHGPTPTDRLASRVEQTDECIKCGDPIDNGGWCGWECLKATEKH